MFLCDARSTRSISSPCYKRFISINWWVSASTACLNIRFTRSWLASSVIISYWQSIVFTHKTRWSVAVKSVVRLQLSSNHFFWAPLYFLSKACLLPTYSIYFMTVIDRYSIAFYVPLIFNVLSLLIYLNFHEISQLD